MIAELKNWLAALGDATLSSDDVADLRTLLDLVQTADQSSISNALKAAQLIGLAGAPQAVFERALLPADKSGTAHVAALVAAAFAALRIDLKARPDATLVRRDISNLADAAYAAAGEQSVDAIHFCLSIAGIAIEQISEKAATLAPIVRVETGIPIPSSLAAYDLYGDAGRGSELVERNRHGAPLLMPLVFEAVAQ